MNAIAKEKTQTVATTGAAMPGQTAQAMPEMIWKQYVDSASGVVEQVSLKNKFLIVDVNQHTSKQNPLPGLANSGYKPLSHLHAWSRRGYFKYLRWNYSSHTIKQEERRNVQTCVPALPSWAMG